MLKKIIVCFTLMILVLALNSTKDKTELVYNEIDTNNEGYKQIYILFENNILTTKNFEDYFRNFQVLEIYPYVNPIYANKIRPNYKYVFNHKSHAYDLSEFQQGYIKTIRNLGLISEANGYQLNGIIIQKVLIHTTVENMTLMLKDIPRIKYSFELNGIYKQINYS